LIVDGAVPVHFAISRAELLFRPTEITGEDDFMNRKIKIIGAASLIALSLISLLLYNLNSGNPYEWVLAAEYDKIYDFKDGKACVEKGDEKWMIHSDGALTEINLDIDYEYLKDTLKLVTIISDDQRLYGVKNLLEETILETKYEFLSVHLDEFLVAAEKSNGGPILIFDRSGALIKEIEIQRGSLFYGISGFVNGYSSFSEYLKAGFLNSNGEVVIEPQFSDVGDFINGYARAMKDTSDDISGTSMHRWGLIDEKGNVVIDFKYTYMGDYSDGLIAFSTKDRSRPIGFMDINENVIISPQYWTVDDFSNGIAIVAYSSFFNRFTDRPGWKTTLIDKNNNHLYTFKRIPGIVVYYMQDNFIYVFDIVSEKEGLIKNPLM